MTRIDRDGRAWPRVTWESVPVSAPASGPGAGRRVRATIAPLVASATPTWGAHEQRRCRAAGLELGRLDASFGAAPVPIILTWLVALERAGAGAHRPAAGDLVAALAGCAAGRRARVAAGHVWRLQAWREATRAGVSLGAVVGVWGAPAGRDLATADRHRPWRGELLWERGSDLGPAQGATSPPAPGRLDALVADLVAWARRDDLDPVAAASIAAAQATVISPLNRDNALFSDALADSVLATHGLQRAALCAWALGQRDKGRATHAHALDAYRDGDTTAVVAAGRDAVERGTARAGALLGRLAQAREAAAAAARPRTGSAARALLDALPDLPWVTAAEVRRRTGCSQAAAYQALRALAEANVLTRVSPTRRDTVWAETAALTVVDEALRAEGMAVAD